jgi:hypothetical protein
MKDVAIQTLVEETTPDSEAISKFRQVCPATVPAKSLVYDLSTRVEELEVMAKSQDRSSSLAEHAALVNAYKGLLRVEAEKRLDLVAMVSSFKEEVAACKSVNSRTSVSLLLGNMHLNCADHQVRNASGWSQAILSHLGVAVAVYVVNWAVSTY